MSKERGEGQFSSLRISFLMMLLLSFVLLVFWSWGRPPWALGDLNTFHRRAPTEADPKTKIQTGRMATAVTTTGRKRVDLKLLPFRLSFIVVVDSCCLS